jgi:putative ABC transport system permease protein
MEKYRQYLVEGRLPRELDEVIVGSFLAANLGVQVGDRMPLFGTPILGISEYRVTGIYNSDINWENGGLVVNARILQERLDAGNSYILVFVYTSRADAERVQARIEEILPDLVAVPAGQVTKEFSQQLEILDDFVLLVTIIALVVGVLGVLNTMMMSVSERTREIGMLRAVGWTRRRVLGVILAEGVLLSLVGAGLGLAMGVAGTELLIRMMPDALLTAKYSVATLGKGVMVGLGVGLLATAYPALRASRLRPVEALRYE